MLFQLIYSYHEIMSFAPEKKVGSIPTLFIILHFLVIDRVLETVPVLISVLQRPLSDFIDLNSFVALSRPIV